MALVFLVSTSGRLRCRSSGHARVARHGQQTFVATSSGAASGEAMAAFDHAAQRRDWPVVFRLARGCWPGKHRRWLAGPSCQ